MTKDTQKIVIITSAVALGGVLLYFVFGSPKAATTSPIAYTSGNVQTNPSTGSNQIVSAEIGAGQTLFNKGIDYLFPPKTTSDNSQG